MLRVKASTSEKIKRGSIRYCLQTKEFMTVTVIRKCMGTGMQKNKARLITGCFITGC